MKPFVCMVLAMLLAGCGGWMEALGTALSVADAGQRAFFNRHPHPTRRAEVEAVLAALELAKARGDEAAAARLYEKLYTLLGDYGVLTATPPQGGSEAEAPTPLPVPLPAPQELF